MFRLINFFILFFLFFNIIFSQQTDSLIFNFQEDDFRPIVEYLASDELEGREAGSTGERIAGGYISDWMQAQNLKPWYGDTNPFQYFSYKESKTQARNVIFYIKGKNPKLPAIVISAHYDHLGKDKKNRIFNGADDNASGTSVVMNMAKYFSILNLKGIQPTRTLIFLLVSAEEKGLYGSAAFVAKYKKPKEVFYFNLNMDMVGRRDEKYQNINNYLYVIGENKFVEFGKVNQKVNENGEMFKFDYTYDDPKHPDQLYYRSDHVNFMLKGIPFLFFFRGIHSDYHKISDDSDKIEYDTLIKVCRHACRLVWVLANIQN